MNINYNQEFNERTEVKIMQQNYSQRLEIQIPRENIYTGLEIRPDFDDEFERLSKNYKIHRIDQVKKFIKKNSELIGYINTITPIIEEYFPKNLKCITFCQDYEFEELNDITIYIHSSDDTFDEDCKKFDELEIEIIELNEFSTNITKLLSMDLWLI